MNKMKNKKSSNKKGANDADLWSFLDDKFGNLKSSKDCAELIKEAKQTP